MRRAIGTAVVVAGTLLAACSDGGRSTSDVDVTPTIDEARDGAAGPASGYQEARMDDVVLRSADLPSGWVPTGDPVDAEADFDDMVDRCLAMEEDEAPSAESALVRAPLTMLATSAVARPSPDVAAREFRLLSGPSAAACVSSALRAATSELPPGAVVQSALPQTAAYPAIGEGSVAYRLSASAVRGDATTVLVVDVLFFYEDRVRMSVVTANPTEPLDVALVVDAARTMADRVGAAP